MPQIVYFSPTNWAPQDQEDITHDSIGLTMAQARCDPTDYPCATYSVSLTTSWFLQEQPCQEDATVIRAHVRYLGGELLYEYPEVQEVRSGWRVGAYIPREDC